MRISLCGYYGKNNFGDDMMATLLSEKISQNKHAIKLFSDCSNGTFDYRKTSFLDTDLIVIGGGGIIDTKFWALSEANIEEMRKSKIPIVFLNVNIYQESLNNSQFVKSLFDLNASWWVRDKFTYDELKKLNFKVKFLPDILFTLKLENKNKINKKLLNIFLNYYAFKPAFDNENVAAWIDMQSKCKELASYLDWLTTFGWNIQLVPCQSSQEIDDRVISSYIYGLCKNKSKISWISKPTNWRNIIKIIADSDLVISQRYHSSVASMSLGIRFVDITHHSKNIELIKDASVTGASVLLKNLNKNNLIDATRYAEFNSNYKNNIINYKTNAMRLWRDFETDWDNFIISLEK
jgi:polysaccharide pyruvyl transferase WcaK-like protein